MHKFLNFTSKGALPEVGLAVKSTIIGDDAVVVCSIDVVVDVKMLVVVDESDTVLVVNNPAPTVVVVVLA